MWWMMVFKSSFQLKMNKNNIIFLQNFLFLISAYQNHKKNHLKDINLMHFQVKNSSKRILKNKLDHKNKHSLIFRLGLWPTTWLARVPNRL
jgi:hypothetical protein